MIWGWALRVFLVISFAVFVISISQAHEWYSKSCCSGGDCQPAPQGSVVLTDKGYEVQEWVVNPDGVPLGLNITIPFGHEKILPIPGHAYKHPESRTAGMYICTGNRLVRCIYLDTGI